MRSLFNRESDSSAPADAAPAASGWESLPGSVKLGGSALLVGGLLAAVILPGMGGHKQQSQQVQEPRENTRISDYEPPPTVQNASANLGDTGKPHTPVRHHRHAGQDSGAMALYADSETTSVTPAAASAKEGDASATGRSTSSASLNESGVRVTMLKHPSYTIRTGSTIPCTSVEANDSSRPGWVTCSLATWYRSSDQTRGLLPPGTRIVGQIREGLQQYQRRLGVVYTKIEAQHFTVTFPGVGADAMGRSGEDADINTFFWDRAGAVALYALMDVAVGTGQNLASAGLSRAISGGGAGYGSTVQFGGQAESLGGQEMQATINRPPVAQRDQGLPLVVQVGEDIDLYDACRQAAEIDPLSCPLQ